MFVYIVLLLLLCRRDINPVVCLVHLVAITFTFSFLWKFLVLFSQACAGYLLMPVGYFAYPEFNSLVGLVLPYERWGEVSLGLKIIVGNLPADIHLYGAGSDLTARLVCWAAFTFQTTPQLTAAPQCLLQKIPWLLSGTRKLSMPMA
jgi:hypothetical protein